MSRIDDLIRELCPEGVPTYQLDEMVKFEKGEHLSDANFEPGFVPVVTASRSESRRHARSNVDARAVTVTSHGAYAGHVNFWNEPIWLAGNVFLLRPTPQIVSEKYLFYVLKASEGLVQSRARGGGIPYMNSSDLKGLKFPVPPLEVQREIVSILDKFTQLEAELEAELEARRTQYEVTRDRLLDFSGDLSAHPMGEMIRELCPDGVDSQPLGELVVNRDNERRPVSRGMREPGEIPYYGANGVQDYVSSHIFEGTFLLVGEDGSVCDANGHPVLNWASGKIWVNNHAHVLQEKDAGPLLRYLYFYLSGLDVASYITGGTQKKINQSSLNKIPVALPPLAVQTEIVSILDKLFALVNSLSFGLPAEIKARRKQYDHYRNKLLNFKTLDAA